MLACSSSKSLLLPGLQRHGGVSAEEHAALRARKVGVRRRRETGRWPHGAELGHAPGQWGVCIGVFGLQMGVEAEPPLALSSCCAQDKWKQRCDDLRAELTLARAEAAAAEAALQERLAAAEDRVRGSAKKASSEASRLRDKLKVRRVGACVGASAARALALFTCALTRLMDG